MACWASQGWLITLVLVAHVWLVLVPPLIADDLLFTTGDNVDDRTVQPQGGLPEGISCQRVLFNLSTGSLVQGMRSVSLLLDVGAATCG